MVKNFALLLCLLLQLQATASAASGTSFTEFSALRDAVIDRISTAKKRVWLASEFMSDFDIALALYIAKFRELDVRVILAQDQVGNFLSQYDYLSEHGVMIKTTTDSGIGTDLLCDDELTSIDSDLDFLSDRKSFTWREAKQKETIKVAERFKRVFNSGLNSNQVAYDYSRKVYRRPSDVAHKLPSKTIADKKPQHDKSKNTKSRL